jgi:chitin disaccharide deacetylase
VTTLVERLGRSPDARLLIVSCDGLGFAHAVNEGVFTALRDGVATSATLMVPAPWARGAAAAYRGEDVGVLLTLNADHDTYRWGPLTQAPSLLDGDGGFPRTLHDVWEHADLDEVRRECRAQIERAIYWGFDVSHLDSHLFAMQLRPEFFDVYLDLAVDFGLPVRLPGPAGERAAGFPFRALAAERGVVFPDHLISTGHLLGGGRVTGRGAAELVQLMAALPAGVTELALRPAIDSPELRAVAPAWRDNCEDHRMLVSPDAMRAAVAAGGVELIGFRELRRLAQAARVSP